MYCRSCVLFREHVQLRSDELSQSASPQWTTEVREAPLTLHDVQGLIRSWKDTRGEFSLQAPPSIVCSLAYHSGHASRRRACGLGLRYLAAHMYPTDAPRRDRRVVSWHHGGAGSLTLTPPPESMHTGYGDVRLDALSTDTVLIDLQSKYR